MTSTPNLDRPATRRNRLAAAGILAITVATAGLGTLPAQAAVDTNPHAVMFGPVSCPQAGLYFEEVWLPTPQATPGHVLDGNVVGVAKSLYLTDSAGNPVFAIFDRPGNGLDKNTVWCFWPFPGSPTGYGGGDILFNANLRP